MSILGCGYFLKVIAKENGGIWKSQLVGYDQLLRKYRLEGNERGSTQEWKERVHERNRRDWIEEVKGKSSLKWYQLAKEEAGL